MEGDSSFTFGPTTPFKAGPDDQVSHLRRAGLKESVDHTTLLGNTLYMTYLWLQAKKSSDDPRKALPETQKKTVSGLFGSPTFDSGATGSSTSKPNTLLDGNKRDKDETATLAQIQYVHHTSPYSLCN